MKALTDEERIAQLEVQLEQTRASSHRLLQSVLSEKVRLQKAFEEKERLQKLCDQQLFEIVRLANQIRNRHAR